MSFDKLQKAIEKRLGYTAMPADEADVIMSKLNRRFNIGDEVRLTDASLIELCGGRRGKVVGETDFGHYRVDFGTGNRTRPLPGSLLLPVDATELLGELADSPDAEPG